ncbi:MAG: glycosyltransferase family 1 protein [Cytophagaceae bacterium]|nr:glycosyltransferase family 1 protein [Cytophagaceae bacterium]
MREDSIYPGLGPPGGPLEGSPAITFNFTTDSLLTERRRASHSVSSVPTELTPDLLCFSHLRWDFVFQRPQHLLTRANRHSRVFFIEEPIFVPKSEIPRMEIRRVGERLYVATPRLHEGLSPEDLVDWQRDLVDLLIDERCVQRFTAWYYTPMALAFSDHLQPQLTVYDCMDELSAFRGAPTMLLDWERRLYERTDLVFTGGQSLFEAKQGRHPRVYAFPSSIDKSHFGKARQPISEPEDQQCIEGIKLGFFGVIDERFDIDLLASLATRRPEWQFLLLGPVVKIAPESLPQNANIHYLGMKSYDELPNYIGHWHTALLPFALNESTRFISPTKTPEYLAAGRPVVSTPIRDVVRPYGEEGLVQIAATVDDFERAIEKAIANRLCATWLADVDNFLSTNSWDLTWERMQRLMAEQLVRQARMAASIGN